MNKIKWLVFSLNLLGILYFTLPSLNPFQDGMFTYHDITQVARVSSFTTNLVNLNIPPRLAPEFSFNLGFPVFNFYAPTAYWITSLIVLLGFSAVSAVKISFLLTVLLSYLGMSYLLSKLFDYFSSLLGATVYVTSTYFATEIFVRGNLAECWFLTLLPISMGLLIESSRNTNKKLIFPTAVSLSLLFTAHNMLSLFGILLILTTLLFLPNIKKNLLIFLVALLIDSYFFIPAFLESSWVQASKIAQEYPYGQHFLCPWQLWSANGWLFGGSLAGCDADTMSFKLGKFQLILAGIGLMTLLWKMFRTRKIKETEAITLLIAAVTIGSIFLSVEYSKPIWDFFSNIMALFQFPWRFLAFAMFGLAILASYSIHQLPQKYNFFVVVPLLVILCIPAKKYFVKPLISNLIYQENYNSDKYKEQQVAYKMKEYLDVDADYNYWSSFNQSDEKLINLGFDYHQPLQFFGRYTNYKVSPFINIIEIHDTGTAYMNLHYFPFWQAIHNEKHVIPSDFDKLGRPRIQLMKGDRLTIHYAQTYLEKTSNSISLAAIIFLALISFAKLNHIFFYFKNFYR